MPSILPFAGRLSLPPGRPVSGARLQSGPALVLAPMRDLIIAGPVRLTGAANAAAKRCRARATSPGRRPGVRRSKAVASRFAGSIRALPRSHPYCHVVSGVRLLESCIWSTSATLTSRDSERVDHRFAHMLWITRWRTVRVVAHHRPSTSGCYPRVICLTWRFRRYRGASSWPGRCAPGPPATRSQW